MAKKAKGSKRNIKKSMLGGCIGIYKGKEYTSYEALKRDVQRDLGNPKIYKHNPFYLSHFFNDLFFRSYTGYLTDGNPGNFKSDVELVKRSKTLQTPGHLFYLNHPLGLSKNNHIAIIDDPAVITNYAEGQTVNPTDGVIFEPSFVSLQKFYSRGGDLSNSKNYIAAQKPLYNRVDLVTGDREIIKCSISSISPQIVAQSTTYHNMLKTMLSKEAFILPEDVGTLKAGSQVTLFDVYDSLEYDDHKLLDVFSKYKSDKNNPIQSIDGRDLSFEDLYIANMVSISTAKQFGHDGYNPGITTDSFSNGEQQVKTTLIDNNHWEDILDVTKEDQDVAYAQQVFQEMIIGKNNNERINKIFSGLADLTNRGLNEVEEKINQLGPYSYLRNMALQTASRAQNEGAYLNAISDPNVNLNLQFVAKRVYSLFANSMNKIIKPRFRGGRYVQNPGDFIDMYILKADLPDIGKKAGQRLTTNEVKKFGISPELVEKTYGLNHFMFKDASGKELFNQDIVNATEITPSEIMISFDDFYKEFGFTDIRGSELDYLKMDVADITTINLLDGKMIDYRDLGENKQATLIQMILANQVDLNNTIGIKALRNLENLSPQQQIAPEDIVAYFDRFEKQLNVLAGRVPASSTASAFSAKVIGFINGHSNTVWASSKKNALDGSDYDIDELSIYFFEDTTGYDRQRMMFENDPQKDPETEYKAAKDELDARTKNEILEAALSYYSDINNIPFFMTPVSDTELGKQIDEMVEDLKKKAKVLPEDKKNTFMSNLESFENNMMGKDTIGIFANAIKAHSYIYNAYKDSKGDDISFEFMGNKYTSLSGADNNGNGQALDNTYIISFLADILQAALDNAKNTVLAKMFVNPQTAFIAAGLAHNGVPRNEIISLFLSEEFQNIMGEVVDSKSLGKSPDFATYEKTAPAVIENHIAFTDSAIELIDKTLISGTEDVYSFDWSNANTFLSQYERINSINTFFTKSQLRKSSDAGKEILNPIISRKDENRNTYKSFADNKQIDVFKQKIKALIETTSDETSKSELQKIYDKADTNLEDFVHFVFDYKRKLNDIKSAINAGFHLSSVASVVSINQGIGTANFFELNKEIDNYEFYSGKKKKNFLNKDAVEAIYYGLPVSEFGFEIVDKETGEINVVRKDDFWTYLDTPTIFRKSDNQINDELLNTNKIDIDKVLNGTPNLKAYMNVAYKTLDTTADVFLFQSAPVKALIDNTLRSLHIDSVEFENNYNEIIKNFFGALTSLYLENSYGPGTNTVGFMLTPSINASAIAGKGILMNEQTVDTPQSRALFLNNVTELFDTMINNVEFFQDPALQQKIKNNAFLKSSTIELIGDSKYLSLNNFNMSPEQQASVEKGMLALDELFVDVNGNPVNISKTLFLYQLVRNSLKQGKNDYSDYLNTSNLHGISNFIQSISDLLKTNNTGAIDIFNNYFTQHLGLTNIAKNITAQEIQKPSKMVNRRIDQGKKYEIYWKDEVSKVFKPSSITKDGHEPQQYVRPLRTENLKESDKAKVLETYPEYIRVNLRNPIGSGSFMYNMRLVYDNEIGWIYKKAINQYSSNINNNIDINKALLIDEPSYKNISIQDYSTLLKARTLTKTITNNVFYKQGIYKSGYGGSVTISTSFSSRRENKITINYNESLESDKVINIRKEIESRMMESSVDKILSLFNKVFPKIKYEVMNEESFIAKVLEVDPTIGGTNKVDFANGFIHNGVVYLRASRLTSDLAFHEYGHVISELIKKSDNEAWNSIVDSIRKTAIYKQVSENSLYADSSDEVKANEAFSIIMQEAGRAIFSKAGKRSEFSNTFDAEQVKYKNIFNRIFDLLKKVFSKAFGLDTDSERKLLSIDNSSLSGRNVYEIVNFFTDRIASGEYISSISSEELTSPTYYSQEKEIDPVDKFIIDNKIPLEGMGLNKGKKILNSLREQFTDYNFYINGQENGHWYITYSKKKISEENKPNFSLSRNSNLHDVKEVLMGASYSTLQQKGVEHYRDKMVSSLKGRGPNKDGVYKYSDMFNTYNYTASEVNNDAFMLSEAQKMIDIRKSMDSKMVDDTIEYLTTQNKVGILEKRSDEFIELLSNHVPINPNDVVIKYEDLKNDPKYSNLYVSDLFGENFNPVFVISEYEGEATVGIYHFTTEPLSSKTDIKSRPFSKYMTVNDFKSKSYKLTNDILSVRKFDLANLAMVLKNKNPKLNVRDISIINMRESSSESPVAYGVALSEMLPEINDIYSSPDIKGYLPKDINDAIDNGIGEQANFTTDYIKELLYFYKPYSDLGYVTGKEYTYKLLYNDIYNESQNGYYDNSTLLKIIDNRLAQLVNEYKGDENAIVNNIEYLRLYNAKVSIKDGGYFGLEQHGDMNWIKRNVTSQSNVSNPIAQFFISMMRKTYDKILNKYRPLKKGFDKIYENLEKEQTALGMGAIELIKDLGPARFKNLMVQVDVNTDQGVKKVDSFEIYYRYTDEKGKVHEHPNLSSANLTNTELEMGGYIVKTIRDMMIEKRMMEIMKQKSFKSLEDAKVTAEEWYEKNWRDGWLPIMTAKVKKQYIIPTKAKDFTAWIKRYSTSNELYDYVDNQKGNFHDINDYFYGQAGLGALGSDYRSNYIGLKFNPKTNNYEYTENGLETNESNERNLENIFAYFTMNHLSKKNFEALMPDYYGAQTLLKAYEKSGNVEGVRTYLKDLTKFIVKGERQSLEGIETTFKIGNKSVNVKADDAVNNMGTLSVFGYMAGNVTMSVTNLATNLVNVLSLGTTGSLLKNNPFYSIKDLTKAISWSLKNFDTFRAIIDEYRLIDGDIKEQLSSERFLKSKKMFNSYHLYWLNFAGDYAFRGFSFVAQMIKDGSLEAHSVDEYGSLVYDETKDKRWDGSKESEVIKNKIKENLKEEGVEPVDGKLTRAYDNNIRQAHKAIADRFTAGTYNSSEKRLVEANVIGRMFSTFHKYFFDKMEGFYTETHRSKTFGNYVVKKDKNGNDYAAWEGTMMEGKFQSMVAFANSIASLKDKSFDEFMKEWNGMDPIRKQNIIKLTQDMVVVYVMLTLSSVLGGDDDKEKKMSYWQKLWYFGNDNKFAKSVKYGVTDLIADVNPSEYIRLVQQPFVVFTQMKNLSELITSGFDPNAAKKTFGVYRTYDDFKKTYEEFNK